MVIATRPVYSAACGAFLALSLFFKLPHLSAKAGLQLDSNLTSIASLLERHGYRADLVAPPDDMAWVVGHLRDCTVRVSEVSPQGWHQSLITQIAEDNRLYYTFDGASYPGQPILRTRFYHYWGKLKRSFGLDVQKKPVLAVIATPTCEALPLAELSALPNQ
ncbi:hypothetical protein [Microvirga rosea]|uniref:hypothetical protein n=1 Tax=Microvirga rosea TaxID=2715425 RepID=UPI001D0BD156|nr:hypothetical protein [Microvirga rosea]MCB8818942.1 hypothetical protein [Microvirga rosea]